MLDLFNTSGKTNLLPFDGEVYYWGKVLMEPVAKEYLKELLDQISWENDEVFIYGKHIITDRKVAWYGDEHFEYTYSNTTKTALPWTKSLLELKNLVEQYTGTVYNSCLLNLYHSGEEGMSWHSDDEKALGRHTSIASLSFGAERKFSFKHKVGKQVVSLVLEHGSLLEMKGSTQSHWLHSLPKTTKVKRPRINLTFRTIVKS